ncbi:MAG: PIN domain-containing protein [Halochromatium sp.]|nr:PIN domain-containing protein [Halochromatium sp.]
MNLVVDASVALKWFFREREDEDDVEPALALLADIGNDHCRLWQPPHFLAEVAAVLAREKPEAARDDLTDLRLLQWQIVDNQFTYELAIDLSIRLRHHLFDTLYHAAAMRTGDAILVTADETYFNKARHLGGIVLLSDFPQSLP